LEGAECVHTRTCASQAAPSKRSGNTLVVGAVYTATFVGLGAGTSFSPSSPNITYGVGTGKQSTMNSMGAHIEKRAPRTKDFLLISHSPPSPTSPAYETESAALAQAFHMFYN
ncbi:hypothetical protein FRC08_015005, partial [Ceratobasidium sp. 394]